MGNLPFEIASGTSSDGLQRRDEHLFGSHSIGTFQKLLFIRHPGRVGIRVGKAINLERPI
jgi:hypothetical protein